MVKAGARFVLMLAGAAAAAPAPALETDQFLVWDRELTDAAPAVNAFLNAELETVLGRVNRAPERVACTAIPARFYRRLVPTLLVYSRIRRFLNLGPGVERYPDREVGYFGYLEQSIYRRPTWPYLLPMARTVSIGGVHVGVDKVAGHMFGFGRRYYRRYQRLRARGWSEQDAMERVVRRGLHNELTLVGGLADGVVSPADLEANFQGLLLAVDFCAGPAPLLELGPGGWRTVRPLDLARYVSPLLDETFNLNHYVGYRWSRVREALAGHCPQRRSAAVADRMRRYVDAAPASLSSEIIRAALEDRGPPLLERSLDAVCPAPATEEALAARSASP